MVLEIINDFIKGRLDLLDFNFHPHKFLAGGQILYRYVHAKTFQCLGKIALIKKDRPLRSLPGPINNELKNLSIVTMPVKQVSLFPPSFLTKKPPIKEK